MNDQDRVEIEKIFTKIMDDRSDAFHVPDKQHFLDHEQMVDCRINKEDWIENHDFVKGIRKNKAIIEKTSLSVFVTAVCLSLIGFFGWLFDIFTIKIGG